MGKVASVSVNNNVNQFGHPVPHALNATVAHNSFVLITAVEIHPSAFVLLQDAKGFLFRKHRHSSVVSGCQAG
jgi:hypothetical protein